MLSHRLFFCVLCCAFSIGHVKSTGITFFRDVSTLIPPCSTRELVKVIPTSTDVLVYFYDRSTDGSYVYGYILSNGERRYESGTQYYGALYVEGFFSYRKFVNSKYVYETTRYRAGKDGYKPYRVETTDKPPKIPTLDTRESEHKTGGTVLGNVMELTRPWVLI